MTNKTLIRITTVPASLGGLLTGQLKFMSKYYNVIGIASSGNGTLDKVGREEGIKVIPVEMTRKITPIKDVKATWQLYRIFKNEKPLIVHTHTPKAGILGMLAAYLAKVPHRLHTVAGMPLVVASGPKRKLLNFVEKMTYACATKVYPNSFGLEEIILKNRFARPNKLKVLGNGSSNGIDTDFFNDELFSHADKCNLRNSLNISNEDFVFLYVGRIVKDKGINELIEAFKKLESCGIKNCKLVLVGNFENELDPVLPKTHDEIDTNPNIITTGWQSDVRPYFSISDILAFPSYREGFPNVVMQAGAMGIPSIVSDINGCNEIIVPDKNGVIVPPQDTQSLFEAMQLMYTMKQNQEKACFEPDRIRSLITNRFGRNKLWEAVLLEYQSFS